MDRQLNRLVTVRTLERMIAGLMLGLTVTASSAAPPFRLSLEEQVVRRLERTWLDAYEARDLTAMAAILDPRFSITYEGGQVMRRDDVLDQLRRSKGKPAPKFQTSCVTSRAYGTTVILTGVVTTLSPTGKRTDSRYTDTYVRTGSDWRVAASHLSPAGPDPACRE